MPTRLTNKRDNSSEFGAASQNPTSHVIRIGILFLWLLMSMPLSAEDKEQNIDSIVAVVNNDIIVRSELTEFVEQAIKGLKAQRAALPERGALEKQALERLILIRIQLQLAKQSGITVDDEMINKALANIAQQNKMNLIDFRNRVTKEGMNFTEFREQIRTQIMLGQLQQRNVANRVQVTEDEVDRLLAGQSNNTQRNTMFKIQHILVAVADGAPAATWRQAQLKAETMLRKLNGGFDFATAAATWSNSPKALEGGDLGWFRIGQLPRVFAPHAPKMKVGQLSGLIKSPSGFHIIKLMDAKGQALRYVLHEYQARHILIRTSDLVSDDDAKNRLESLRTRIENGEKFSDLAKANSDDIASGKKGGELGWIGNSDVVAPFAAAMSRLSNGGITIAQTQYGWHLIQVVEKRQRDDTSEHKRKVAKQMIESRKQQELLEAWLRKLRDESFVEYRLGRS